MVAKSKEKVVVMTNMRNVIAWCVAMVFAVVSWSVVAQDDLNSLLKDLESESTEKAEAKAEAKPEAEVEAKAEEAKAEEKAEEAAPAPKAETPVVENPVNEER